MKILFRLYGLSRVAFFSLYFSALMCVMDALDFNWISAFPTDFTCFFNLLPAYPRSLENTGIYARKPSLMLSLVLCHFTKVPVVHKGKRKGTNRPVGGTACPVDMRLARTETECRLALCRLKRSRDQKELITQYNTKWLSTVEMLKRNNPDTYRT